ncbi:cytochrome C oxidase assembly protein [Bacillus cytotoxicus]|uniref:cytochrome C oxidase assembly protein n=1 Tax=Bacillus cytotoxicus TaxID=580165 RepID=UPI000B9619E2|nr:cytochrome C oxidase assembly protein [Bacillus cytotoxicus]AWC29570.1 cytochrome C oxidase assembly protein [Bacillus cytotoxicus]AWC41701.1 cytochrome C oxidase assembly protein [Bacillus cytotoxicus]AWC49632.1 cytochrome C oxidase assembly protein [Bacillus cytotoxicus]AWC53646.1 cytochrome C oxidase assembly protein [Bacillus cytotoxicus]AWC57773.1 cytochrome C oxidase assembly protein [Bacillus cytotoxicus]
MQISSAILCFFLYTYVIIAAIYFGISFYAYRLANKVEYKETYQWVKKYLSPVLEIMNGFVLFLFIGLVAFSTSFVGNKATLFGIGIIIFMLLGVRIGNAVFWNEQKIDGWTGMFIPCMLAAIVTNIEHEYYQLHFWLIIVLTILSVLYISTAFLTYCANEKGDQKGVRFFRRRALFWSVPTMFVIVVIAVIMNGHHFEGWQLFFGTWWIFIISFLAFLGATHYLFHQYHYMWALLFAFAQLLFAFFGQETLVFVFQTFSSFGNIFVFGMLVCSISLYVQQYFYIQKQ